MARGFLDPPYLKTLPTTARTLIRALGRDLAGTHCRITSPPPPGPSPPGT
jgi:hypothetical protein